VVIMCRNNDDDPPDVAWLLHAEQQQSDPLIARFLAATVYVERGESGDGFLIHERSDHSRWVHAYTVLNSVPGIDAGQKVDYTSMAGQDLLAVLPPEVGILLDEGHQLAADVDPPGKDPAGPQPWPGAEPALVRAARAARASTGTRTQVLAALRSTCVFVSRQDDGVPIARLARRGNWLCMFSSALLLQTQLGGGDLLDVLLPALTFWEGPIGLFLDLGTDHEISLSASLIAASRSPSGPADGGKR
jgi:hypothetical protein